MGADFAAEHEAANAGEGRQVDRAALADPRRLGSELIEKNTRVIGEAPGEGAAGGGRAMSGTHGMESGAEGRGRVGGWQNLTGGRETSAAAGPGEFAGGRF